VKVTCEARAYGGLDGACYFSLAKNLVIFQVFFFY